jgi:hypothetical protein
MIFSPKVAPDAPAGMVVAALTCLVRVREAPEAVWPEL